MDIYNNFRLFAEHLSLAQCNDHPGVNHAGVKFIIPGDNLTFYELSINDSGLDSNDKFDGPLGSIGAEIGLPGIEDDVKLYTEYLTSIKDIEKGRAAVGFKVFLNDFCRCLTMGNAPFLYFPRYISGYEKVKITTTKQTSMTEMEPHYIVIFGATGDL